MRKNQGFKIIFFRKNKFLPLTITPRNYCSTTCEIILLFKKYSLQKFYFINIFTFTKFIFYKSSIIYQLHTNKNYNFSLIHHNSFYKHPYSCLQLLTSSYSFLHLLTAPYSSLHLLTAYIFLLQLLTSAYSFLQLLTSSYSLQLLHTAE